MLPVSRVGTGEKGLDVLNSFLITPVRINKMCLAPLERSAKELI